MLQFFMGADSSRHVEASCLQLDLRFSLAARKLGAIASHPLLFASFCAEVQYIPFFKTPDLAVKGSSSICVGNSLLYLAGCCKGTKTRLGRSFATFTPYQDLLTEIQHLRQMLADANEEKAIQVWRKDSLALRCDLGHSALFEGRHYPGRGD